MNFRDYDDDTPEVDPRTTPVRARRGRGNRSNIRHRAIAASRRNR